MLNLDRHVLDGVLLSAQLLRQGLHCLPLSADRPRPDLAGGWDTIKFVDNLHRGRDRQAVPVVSGGAGESKMLDKFVVLECDFDGIGQCFAVERKVKMLASADVDGGHDCLQEFQGFRAEARRVFLDVAFVGICSGCLEDFVFGPLGGVTRILMTHAVKDPDELVSLAIQLAPKRLAFSGLDFFVMRIEAFAAFVVDVVVGSSERVDRGHFLSPGFWFCAVAESMTLL